MKSLFKSNYLIPIKDYEKKLLAFFKTTSADTEKVAKEDAKTPPPPDTPLSKIPTISAKENSCRTILADCNTRLKGNLDVSLSNYDQSYNKLGVLLEKSQAKIDTLQTQKENALSVVVSAIKSKEMLLVNAIGEKTTRLKGLIKELKEGKRVSLRWQYIIVIAINLAFIIGDSAYVAKAFNLVGLSLSEQYAIAIILGLATGFIGAGVVEAYRAKWNMIQKYGAMFLLVGFVLGGYLVVGQLRVSLLAQASADGVALTELSAFKFALINMLIFSAVVIVHGIGWPTREKRERYETYKNAKAEVKELEKDIKADEKALGNLPKELAKKQSLVAKGYNDKIGKIEKFQQVAIASTEEAQTTYNNIFGCSTEFYHQINTFFKSEVGRYVAVMNKYRNDDHYMLMDDSIKDLPNPFEKYKYADDELPQLETNDTSVLPDVNINFDELLNLKNEDYENLIEN